MSVFRGLVQNSVTPREQADYFFLALLRTGLKASYPMDKQDRGQLLLAGFWDWDRAKLLHQNQVIDTGPDFNELAV